MAPSYFVKKKNHEQTRIELKVTMKLPNVCGRVGWADLYQFHDQAVRVMTQGTKQATIFLLPSKPHFSNLSLFLYIHIYCHCTSSVEIHLLNIFSIPTRALSLYIHMHTSYRYMIQSYRITGELTIPSSFSSCFIKHSICLDHHWTHHVFYSVQSNFSKKTTKTKTTNLAY